ncbi:hypothetical protein M0R72_17565 [Candidatus Pacearchaeota archaeon]|nr:hypothetical protein [Candidatus Pacearchaeota archaeon]
MADRDPWIKFRPDYWLTDPELRSCSGRARGALIDTMCLLHYASSYGFLTVNGTKADLNAVAKQLVWRPDTYRKAVKELIEKGVLDEDENGIIYCPRMVSDYKKRQVGRETGALGGNPALKAKTLNPPPSTTPVNPETETDKETDKEKKQRGKPNADALQEFKERMTSVIGDIPPEMIARAQDETARDRRRQ